MTQYERIAAMEHQVIFPNEEDWNNDFWKRNYLVSMGAIGTSYYAVNADCEQDALDYIIDYMEDKHPGLIMDNAEIEEEEYLDEYISGGNHGVYLNIPSHELNIEEI